MKQIKENIFCVIRYEVWLSLIEEDKTAEYARLSLINDGYDFVTKVIPVTEARKTIEEYGMKEKVNNRYGRVWEIPGKSFKQAYKGDLKTKLSTS
jgi:hypothetical protein